MDSSFNRAQALYYSRRETMLPAFDDFGNLPPGIHKCSVEELVARFGTGSEERETEISEETRQRRRRGDAMREVLSAAGYQQTKEKLHDLEIRLTDIESRTDIDPKRLASVRRSYKMMMREYLEDLKLYEVRQTRQNPPAPA